MSLDHLLAILAPALPDMSGEEVADALYLALHLGVPPLAQEQPAQPDVQELEALPVQPTARPRVNNEQPPTLPEPTLPEPTPPVPTLPAPIERPPLAAAGLYAGGQSPDPEAALIFQTPSAPPLPGGMEIARALRPLLLRVPARQAVELDEAATVRQIAEAGLWLPVLRPIAEPRFSAALLLDDTPSMAIWHSAAAELATLLGCHPALRELRAYRLSFSDDEAHLRPGLRHDLQSVPRRAAGELRDPSGCTLVLILSDGVSRPWRDGRMARAISAWSAHAMVSLVQVLPDTLWERSALGRWPAAQVTASAPGATNQHMSYQARRGRMGQPTPTGRPLPVVTLEPTALATWARLAAGVSGAAAPAYLIVPDVAPVTAPASEPPAAPEMLVARFLSSASPLAQRLAGLLAVAAPLSLQVARLVQAALLPATQQIHLAEVWLSGLLRRSPAARPDEPPDEVVYEFFPGVAQRLRGQIPVEEALAVLRHVSAYIGARLGQPRDFRAWVETGIPFALDDPRRPFAGLAAELLDSLGGPYRELAARLARAGGVSLGQAAGVQQTFAQEELEPEPGPEPPVLALPLQRYRLGERIRTTPLAEIYAAEDRLLSRPVHLQLLRRELLDDPLSRQRFQTSASATAFINHPNVVTIYDLEEFEGRPCVACEPVFSTSLRDELRRRATFAWQDMLDSLEPLASTLGEAHLSSIIHGAITPEMIFLRPDGRPVLAGFIGALLPAEQENPAWQQSDSTAWAYRAPEIWEENRLDKESDTYALACLAYELLTGRPLFSAASFNEQRRAHLAGPRIGTLPRGVPKHVAQVLEVGLKTSEVERPYPGAFLYNLKNPEYDQVTAPPRAFDQELRSWRPSLVELDEILFGLYRIEAELGRDSYNTAYWAVHSSLGRTVELKLIHPELASRTKVAHERFPQLIQALAQLSHRNIPLLLDAGQIDGRLYIACELPGDRLDQLLQKDTYGWLGVLIWLEQIADALDYAHTQGVVHGTIMPANIRYLNSVYLHNFAMPMLIQVDPEATIGGPLTISPLLPYLAPELWNGEDATSAGDIYAFAATIYELLTGTILFTGETYAELRQAHERGPQLYTERFQIRGVPTGVFNVLYRALSRSPADRHPTARALVNELGALGQSAQAQSSFVQAPAPAAAPLPLNTPQRPYALPPFEDAPTYYPPSEEEPSFVGAIGLGTTIDLVGTNGGVLRLPGYSQYVATVTLSGSGPRPAPGQLIGATLEELRLGRSGPLMLSGRRDGEARPRNLIAQFLGGLRGRQPIPGYRLREEIGRGATATVQRAYSEQLRREVALKIFNEGRADAARRASLRSEALALRALQGEGVVPLHEYAETGEQAWLATELLVGPSLRQRLRDGSALSWAQAMLIIGALGAVLQRIHNAYHVYADLKPENILVNVQLSPTLIDFGLSRGYLGPQEGQTLQRLLLAEQVERRGGLFAGTPAYMAPEIWQRAPASPASDLYALACLTYELVMGRPLFAAQNMEEAQRAHAAGPQLPTIWPPEAPPGFGAALRRALARQPAERYQTVSEFLQAVEDPGRSVLVENWASTGHKGLQIVLNGSPAPVRAGQWAWLSFRLTNMTPIAFGYVELRLEGKLVEAPLTNALLIQGIEQHAFELLLRPDTRLSGTLELELVAHYRDTNQGQIELRHLVTLEVEPDNSANSSLP